MGGNLATSHISENCVFHLSFFQIFPIAHEMLEFRDTQWHLTVMLLLRLFFSSTNQHLISRIIGRFSIQKGTSHVVDLLFHWLCVFGLLVWWLCLLVFSFMNHCLSSLHYILYFHPLQCWSSLLFIALVTFFLTQYWSSLLSSIHEFLHQCWKPQGQQPLL